MPKSSTCYTVLSAWQRLRAKADALQGASNHKTPKLRNQQYLKPIKYTGNGRLVPELSIITGGSGSALATSSCKSNCRSGMIRHFRRYSRQPSSRPPSLASAQSSTSMGFGGSFRSGRTRAEQSRSATSAVRVSVGFITHASRSTYINFRPYRLSDAVLPGLGQGAVATPQGGLCGLLTHHLHLDLLVCFTLLLAFDEESIVVVSLCLGSSTPRKLESSLHSILGRDHL